MTDKTSLIVLAAGGTGGHVFPAEALARELLGRGYRVALMTDSRGTKFSDDLPIPVYRTRASSLRSGMVGKALSIVSMGVGIFQAEHRLRKLKAAAVVGFGGYPSVPAVYAAAGMHIPFILHEQNAVIGRANRMLMKKAAAVAMSFPHVAGLLSDSKAKLVHTGNPVRPPFVALRGTPYPALDDASPFRILVLGGSLGARVFSHVVPQSLALLPEPLRRRVVIAQQCRKENLEDARQAYAGIGIDAELAPFFNDVPNRMAAAHLFVGRSGGSTVAELTAIGRPSILVPFPHGHAGEQTANAEAIAAAGGAWLIPEKAFSPEALAVRLESLMTVPGTLAKAATAARGWGKITAADALADCVEDILGIRRLQEGKTA
jgi:UDP-N-acetylglucosamine--N-acetylmuramyl-(pentapeptide) pyrophosphoryl-undecaprenol N-acetylglucosamine transferase